MDLLVGSIVRAAQEESCASGNGLEARCQNTVSGLLARGRLVGLSAVVPADTLGLASVPRATALCLATVLSAAAALTITMAFAAAVTLGVAAVALGIAFLLTTHSLASAESAAFFKRTEESASEPNGILCAFLLLLLARVSRRRSTGKRASDTQSNGHCQGEGEDEFHCGLRVFASARWSLFKRET